MSRFGQRNAPSGGPSAIHPFVAPDDSRMGLALAAGQPDLQMAPAQMVADASLRERRCAMTGCGKLREDAIHGIPE